MTDYGLLSLISQLQPDDHAKLVSLGRRKAFRNGETIYEQDEDDCSMGIVVSGQVRLLRRQPNGQLILSAVLPPGHHFGDVVALGIAERTHSAVAVGETVVDLYSRQMFERAMEHPSILRALYFVASCRLFQAVSLLDDVRTLSPEVRLGKVLAAMAPMADEAGRIECLQEDLANLLGVSSVTLAKAFATLKRSGLVETGYRQVTICNLDGLRRWVADRLVH